MEGLYRVENEDLDILTYADLQSLRFCVKKTKENFQYIAVDELLKKLDNLIKISEERARNE